MEVFCPGCHLVIAPKAPDKKFSNGMAFHASCLVRYQLRIDAEFRATQHRRSEPKRRKAC